VKHRSRIQPWALAARRTVPFILAAVLAACGGGGSDSSPPPAKETAGNDQPPPPPSPPAQFTLQLTPEKVAVQHGTSVTVNAKVVREAGFDGAVQVVLGDLPAGVSAAPVTVAAGATDAVITLTAQPSAAHSLPTTVRGRGTSGDKTADDDMLVTVRGLPGAVDTSFAGGKVIAPIGTTDEYVSAIAVQNDGRVVLVGRSPTQFGMDFALLRRSRDGAVDNTFGTNGKVLTAIGAGTASDEAYAAVVQPDDKIVVVGRTDSGATTGNDFAVVRYNADGTLDDSFGSGGKVVTSFGPGSDAAHAVVLQDDGKIVVGGETSQNTSGGDFALARYNSDGTPDATFGNGGKVITAIKTFGGRDAMNGLLLHTVNGEPRILAVGGEGDFVVARYLPDGTLDAAFGNNGRISGLFNATIGAARAAVSADNGKVVIAGHISHDFALVRLNADGTPDPTFGNQGRVLTAVSTTNWDEATAMVRQSDGKLVVGGWMYGIGSSGDFAVVRYGTDGTLDATFGNAGIVVTPMAAGTKNDLGRALLLQADDRVPAVRALQAGEVSDQNHDFGLVRYWL
jgi:uncharacterized delta-60 repeat protein